MNKKRVAAEKVTSPQNIELLFVYFEGYKNLGKVQLNFSGDSFYSIEGDSNLIIKCRTNSGYPTSLFPIEMPGLILDSEFQERQQRFINNVTAIVGENGSGKSNILGLLKKVLTNDLHYNHDVLAIFKINNVIKAFHSFPNEIKSGEGVNFEINKSTSTLSFLDQMRRKKRGETDRVEKLNIPNLNNSRVIFYSPIADLQGYPHNFDNPQYNDISTNYLLEYDQPIGEEYSKSKFDRLLSHKSQSIRRFISLIYSNLPFPKDILDFIPKYTYLQINRLLDPENNSRNLNSDDKRFLDRFRKKLDESWNESFKLKESGNEDGYNKLHTKTELSYSIVLHFFHNKETEYGADSRVDLDQIDWAQPLNEIVKYYFKNQKWRPNGELLLLYDSVIKAIENGTEFRENANNSFSFRIDDNIDMVTLYSNYQEYESIFKNTNHPGGLLDFYWRGISSGEKALLDLFARLLDAKSKNFVNAGARNDYEKPVYQSLFILIDEGEMGFHPQWQKNYLKYLLDFIMYAYSGFNIQLILTSHSPFLISDLPRENVIFLKKEGENSIVVDPKSFSRTFGGNIHEMLIDSFFLKDGIIGAFAQDKINELIKEILSKNIISQSRINELKKLIEAVGEPIVRTKLLHMLSEKKLKDSL